MSVQATAAAAQRIPPRAEPADVASCPSCGAPDTSRTASGKDLAVFDHPDHLSLLAEERRALVAEAAAHRAAARVQAPRRSLRSRLALPDRAAGRQPRLAWRRSHAA